MHSYCSFTIIGWNIKKHFWLTQLISFCFKLEILVTQLKTHKKSKIKWQENNCQCCDSVKYRIFFLFLKIKKKFVSWICLFLKIEKYRHSHCMRDFMWKIFFSTITFQFELQIWVNSVSHYSNSNRNYFILDN